MSNPSFDNIDKWLFEYTEGNLSPNQEVQLEQFLLENPSLEQDLEAWQSTKIGSESVVYPFVEQHTRRPIAWFAMTITVSVVALSVGLGWLALNTDQTPTTFSNAIKIPEKKKDYHIARNKADAKPYKFNPSDLHIALPVFVSDYYGPFCNVIYSSEGFGTLPQNNQQSILSQRENSLDNSDWQEENLANHSSTEWNEEQISDEDNTNNSHNTQRRNAEAMLRVGQKYSPSKQSLLAKMKSSLTRGIIRLEDNLFGLTNSKDIYYHVPSMQALDVNFASAGNLSASRVQTITRMQWTGYSQQQFRNQIAWDTYAKEIRGGIGIQMNHTYYGNGSFQVGQLAVTYSPKFFLSKNFTIEPALRFKMGDKRLFTQKVTQGQVVELDRQRLRVIDNEGVTSSFQDLWYKDVGLALASNTKWFSAGIQVDNLGGHFDNAYNSSSKNNRAGKHIVATLGTDYMSKTKLFSLSPYLMYQKVENLSEIWIGSIFRYKKFTFGGGYSSKGDYVGSIGFKTDRLLIAYNADYTFSSLSNKRLFSQQLTLRILTKNGRYDQRMLNK